MKAHWDEMIAREVGCRVHDDAELLRLLGNTEGDDVQLIANIPTFGRLKDQKFGRVALGIAFYQALARDPELVCMCY